MGAACIKHKVSLAVEETSTPTTGFGDAFVFTDADVCEVFFDGVVPGGREGGREGGKDEFIENSLKGKGKTKMNTNTTTFPPSLPPSLP